MNQFLNVIVPMLLRFCSDFYKKSRERNRISAWMRIVLMILCAEWISETRARRSGGGGKWMHLNPRTSIAVFLPQQVDFALGKSCLRSVRTITFRLFCADEVCSGSKPRQRELLRVVLDLSICQRTFVELKIKVLLDKAFGRKPSIPT